MVVATMACREVSGGGVSGGERRRRSDGSHSLAAPRLQAQPVGGHPHHVPHGSGGEGKAGWPVSSPVKVQAVGCGRLPRTADRPSDVLIWEAAPQCSGSVSLQSKNDALAAEGPLFTADRAARTDLS